MLSNQGNRITIMLIVYFLLIASIILTRPMSLFDVIGLYVLCCIMGYEIYWILDDLFGRNRTEFIIKGDK